FIEHILECIELIEEYTRGVTKEEFFKSKQLQDSVIRRIEVIGEAAKNIPQEIKDKYYQIPWKRISGMRDILVHEYWGIDLNLTWNVATQEMQNIKKSILEIKKDLKVKDD
ncbi:MAG: hypothetical protein A3J73_06710, partial [Planctomycetes bacterium RIFCSPHIGHO2_02_FULL_38_41]